MSGYVGKKTMEYDRNQLDLNGCFLSFFMEPQMIKSNAANGSAYSFFAEKILLCLLNTSVIIYSKV